MFKRIDHIEVVPTNAQNTIDFYVDVLGFQVRGRNEVNMPPMKEVIYLELNDTVVEVISVDNPQPVSEAGWQVGYRALALEVTDMTEAVDYLNRKGVAMALKPVNLGNSFRGEIRDPDGLTIELRQWK